MCVGVFRSMLKVFRSMSRLHPHQGWARGQRPPVYMDVSSSADPEYRGAGVTQDMSLSCWPNCSFIFLGAPDCGGVKETRAAGGLLLLWHGLAARRASPTFAMQLCLCGLFC